LVLTSAVRLRRIPKRSWFGRWYELFLPAHEGPEPSTVATNAPLVQLEPLFGVGDAWALIDAADRAWDGQGNGEWVSLYRNDETPSG
jgi:hypothetical protein